MNTPNNINAARAELALVGFTSPPDNLCEAWLQGHAAAKNWNGNIDDEDSGLDHGFQAARHCCETLTEQVAFREGWRAAMRDRLAAEAAE